MVPTAALSLSSLDESLEALTNVPNELLGVVMNLPYERPIISLVLLGFVIFLVRDLVIPFRKPTR